MESEKVFLVGVNHLKALVNLRERAAVAQDDLVAELRRLKEECGLLELVLLSTCSRVEAYGVSDDPAGAAQAVRRWFESRAGLEISGSLYEKRGREAVHHLFRVASGLDSWIVGESEVLGQVKNAYRAAFDLGITGRSLNRSFQKALGAGKSVRTLTGIQNGIKSIGGAAALLARKIFGAGQGVEILVMGAGQAAEAVARHLIAKDFDRILVANRTLEKAEVLAKALGGSAIPYEGGMGRLATVDMAVFSVSSPGTVLSARDLRAWTALRQRPLFLVDLGLPRNIDPQCSTLEGVYLYDLDDLKEMVRASQDRKAAEQDQAEALARTAAAECCEALDSVPPARVAAGR